MIAFRNSVSKMHQISISLKLNIKIKMKHLRDRKLDVFARESLFNWRFSRDKWIVLWDSNEYLFIKFCHFNIKLLSFNIYLICLSSIWLSKLCIHYFILKIGLNNLFFQVLLIAYSRPGSCEAVPDPGASPEASPGIYIFHYFLQF